VSAPTMTLTVAAVPSTTTITSAVATIERFFGVTTPRLLLFGMNEKGKKLSHVGKKMNTTIGDNIVVDDGN